MNFNFDSLKDTNFVSESQQYLKPYDIYKVKLSEIKKDTLKGKDGTDYKIVTIGFSGEEGVFSTNLFYPSKDSDFERTENEKTHKIQPSAFDRFQHSLMQIVQVLNPAGADKIKENASKIKTLDDFVDLIIKGTSSKMNVEVYLKLVGRNVDGKTYSNLPTPCWYDAKDNKVKPLNFLSTDKNKLNFSSYEIQLANTYKNSKPTDMDEVDPDKKDGDLDLSDLNGIEL